MIDYDEEDDKEGESEVWKMFILMIAISTPVQEYESLSISGHGRSISTAESSLRVK